MAADPSPLHAPVLRQEVVDLLRPTASSRVLDLTVGAGGHSLALLEEIGPEGRLVGVDRDPEVLREAGRVLADPRVTLVESRFGDLPRWQGEAGGGRFDAILLDLGVSSLQLDQGERGFSFRFDAPLDMRMSGTSGITAAELLAQASAEEIASWLREFGEERHAGRIADEIVRRRPIGTTHELARIVRDVVPASRDSKIDPATRTFQALRIVVNGELDELDRFLGSIELCLAPGGRVAVIAYHSLEDRRVKNAFRERADEGDYELLTKRPIRPTTGEVESNPRARSARLRGLERK